MDLVKFNNEISGMRPVSKQTKVHVIHKLTKNAEKLNKKKGSEKEVSRNKQRAERWLQEALFMKLLHVDEIIKFSLQFDASLGEKVLNDVSIPITVKAFARLAMYPILGKAVANFRNRYPDWNKWLEKRLEKLGTGARFGSKMKTGRVKAHMAQRQRVQEAVDTIKREQVKWLCNTGKSKLKPQPQKLSDKGVHSDAINHKTKDDNKSSNNGNASNDSISKVSKKECKITKLEEEKTEKMKGNRCEAKNKHAPVFYEEEDDDSDDEIEKKDNDIGEKDDNEGQDSDSEEDHDIEEKDHDIEEEDHDIEEEDDDSEDSDEEEAQLKHKQSISKTSDKLEKSKKLVEEKQSSDDDEQGSESERNSESESEQDLESKDPESGNEDDVAMDLQSQKRLKKLLKKQKAKEKRIVPRSREVEVCKFSDLLKKAEQPGESDDSDANESGDNKNNSQISKDKGVDPFFMTRNNDFLRIATAKREEKEKEPVRKGPKWGVEGCEDWTGTRRERRARAFGRPIPKKFSDRRGPQMFDLRPYTNRRDDEQHLNAPPPRSNVQAEPEKLHPSWEAKRKQNVSLQGFQGKKVKFDDSD